MPPQPQLRSFCHNHKLDCNLENIGVVLKVIRVLEEQPTAFDVDKAVEEKTKEILTV